MVRGAPRAIRALLVAGLVGLLSAVPAVAADSSVTVTGIEVKSGNLIGLIENPQPDTIEDDGLDV